MQRGQEAAGSESTASRYKVILWNGDVGAGTLSLMPHVPRMPQMSVCLQHVCDQG